MICVPQLLCLPNVLSILDNYPQTLPLSKRVDGKNFLAYISDNFRMEKKIKRKYFLKKMLDFYFWQSLAPSSEREGSHEP